MVTGRGWSWLCQIHFLDQLAAMSDAPVRDEVQQEPKRRRKSGWDVSTTPSATVVDDSYIQQQAQVALLAQQLALQKAQQVIAQQAVQKTLQTTLGGITAQFTKPGCRIYVG